jgi:hypothetical protein
MKGQAAWEQYYSNKSTVGMHPEVFQVQQRTNHSPSCYFYGATLMSQQALYWIKDSSFGNQNYQFAE